jgi:hypothetical protein
MFNFITNFKGYNQKDGLLFMSVKLILTEGAVMSSEVTSHNNME